MPTDSNVVTIGEIMLGFTTMLEIIMSLKMAKIIIRVIIMYHYIFLLNIRSIGTNFVRNVCCSPFQHKPVLFFAGTVECILLAASSACNVELSNFNIPVIVVKTAPLVAWRLHLDHFHLQNGSGKRKTIIMNVNTAIMATYKQQWH